MQKIFCLFNIDHIIMILSEFSSSICVNISLIAKLSRKHNFFMKFTKENYYVNRCCDRRRWWMPAECFNIRLELQKQTSCLLKIVVLFSHIRSSGNSIAI